MMFVVSEMGRVERSYAERGLAAEGLTLRTYWILACLHESSAMSQQQVCAALSIDRSDMVRLIDDLESRELVQRQKDTKDRRKHLLSLTKTGERARRSGAEVVEHASAQAYSALTTKERHTLHRLALRALGQPKKFADPDG